MSGVQVGPGSSGVGVRWGLPNVPTSPENCMCVSASSFSQVSSPSLGVYQMQMGQLTLEVSSGDITREASDVIINSSNADFTLKSGDSSPLAGKLLKRTHQDDLLVAAVELEPLLSVNMWLIWNSLQEVDLTCSPLFVPQGSPRPSWTRLDRQLRWSVHRLVGGLV